MIRKVPLIVILGSTGTGKTKLSLELAERFGGEIISADSMQVYANLDIVTAKATKAEQSRVRHHLLDVATPAEPFTVVHFRNVALPIIDGLLSQSKCPIVVGGTNYYIESLLWDILVSPAVQRKQSNQPTTAADAAVGHDSDATVSGNVGNRLFLADTEMSEMSSALLHNHLRTIDPVTADRIHPNNKRKIVRAIEYYQQSGGQTLSSKLKEQRQQPGGNRLGGPLRYPHTILFWLRCNQDVLNARLDGRVDAMLQQGLLHELRTFHNQHILDRSPTSYTRGILQTIGFKEFIPYLEQFKAADDERIADYLRRNAYKLPIEGSSGDPSPDTEDVSSKDPLAAGLAVLSACLNELKLVTRRYSRKQIKWINNRFLASRDRQVPDLYELDTSDVSAWQERVYARAVTVIDCYRKGEECEVQPLTRRVHPGEGLNEETSNYCAVCERHFVGEYQWQLHLKSNKHKKRKEAAKKKQKQKQTQKEEPKQPEQPFPSD